MPDKQTDITPPPLKEKEKKNTNRIQNIQTCKSIKSRKQKFLINLIISSYNYGRKKLFKRVKRKRTNDIYCNKQMYDK